MLQGLFTTIPTESGAADMIGAFDDRRDLGDDDDANASDEPDQISDSDRDDDDDDDDDDSDERRADVAEHSANTVAATLATPGASERPTRAKSAPAHAWRYLGARDVCAGVT
jgi:hypothetical protein